MPIVPTSPGVYIEEIPSGVRTIVGVSTSTTAFVGRARKGPTDTATIVNSWSEYERTFGGLSLISPMSFAVRDFFLNGGSKAVIVRLFEPVMDTADPPAEDPPASAVVSVDLETGTILKLGAANPGLWGRNLRVKIDGAIKAESATALGASADKMFNIKITDAETGMVEEFKNLTLTDSARRADSFLAANSKLLRWDTSIDLSTTIAFTIATDDVFIDEVSVLEDLLAEAKKGNSVTLPDGTDTSGMSLTEIVAAINALIATAKSDMGGQDGTYLSKDPNFCGSGTRDAKAGLYALEQTKGDFNILVIPPYLAPTDPDSICGDVDAELVAEAAVYCEERMAMLIVDPPEAMNEKAEAQTAGDDPGGALGTNSKNAAFYFPRIQQKNPLRENRVETFVSSGVIAGIWARTDTQRGVWKAPAGLEATLIGVPDLALELTDAENGDLNQLGLNCLRVRPPAGRIVWGARTLQGDDRLGSEWKYVPVRRTALYIEKSLLRGLQWVVFEPNDEPLWSQIRLNVGAFMHNLFKQGAFKGSMPKDAYLVKCDKETTTDDDINRGVVNIVVGFAPLKPAEFVIIKLQQLAGQVES